MATLIEVGPPPPRPEGEGWAQVQAIVWIRAPQQEASAVEPEFVSARAAGSTKGEWEVSPAKRRPEGRGWIQDPGSGHWMREVRDPWLGLPAVAEMLGANERTVRRWVKAGSLPAPVELSQAAWRWRESEIAAHLESRRLKRGAAAQEPVQGRGAKR